VVVGLGNSERAYARTRHNLGAMAVARAVERLGLRAAPGLTPLPEGRTAFVLPTGFMNESGSPVRRAVERWRPAPHGLLIVHDDMALPLGAVREKEGGGHGGHNGLRDVMAALGTGAFKRLRLGIGRPLGRTDPANYVLSPFRPEERDAVELLLEQASEAILTFTRQPLPF
jgi:PTH1 family peptidyl-tRNA hydrolase